MGDRNACSRLSVRVLTSSEPAERRANGVSGGSSCESDSQRGECSRNAELCATWTSLLTLFRFNHSIGNCILSWHKSLLHIFLFGLSNNIPASIYLQQYLSLARHLLFYTHLLIFDGSDCMALRKSSNSRDFYNNPTRLGKIIMPYIRVHIDQYKSKTWF